MRSFATNTLSSFALEESNSSRSVSRCGMVKAYAILLACNDAKERYINLLLAKSVGVVAAVFFHVSFLLC